MLFLFKRKSQSMPNIFLCRKQRNMLVIQTKVFIFALAIREDIDASIKSVGCKYIKIVPNGKHGKIDPVGTDEIDPVKTA